MKNERNQNHESANNLAKRLDRLSELLKGSSAAKIPEEALAELQFVRIQESDGGVRLMPEERFKDMQKQEKQPEVKKAPFESFTFSLDLSETTRSIQVEEIRDLSERLDRVEDVLSSGWHYELEGQENSQPIDNMYDFFDNFLNTYRNFIPDFPDVSIHVMDRLFHFALPTWADDESFDSHFFLADYTDLTGTTVKHENAVAMQKELIRMMGHFGDVSQLRKIFFKNLQHSVKELCYDQTEEENKSLQNFFDTYGIKTFTDLIRFAIPKYLKQHGLNGMADVIKNVSDVSSLTQQLSLVKIPISDEEKLIREQLRQLAQQLKNADGEGKLKIQTQLEKLNNKRKNIEWHAKYVEKIRSGVISFFDSPKMYGELCSRTIRHAADFLSAGKKDRSIASITIDPTPDPVLDKDPGKLSGDCTEGKPLPFAKRKDTHNVKVFIGTGEERKHIGNMYFLETTNYAREKVWHIDAMQIPYAGIDWEIFLPKLIEGLSENAQKKGVGVITVNAEDTLLSNYDYLQDAIKGYWQKVSTEEMNIHIPSVTQNPYDSEESNFQGNGEALVLWRSTTSRSRRKS